MNILWLKRELLHPVNRGGRIRTHAMLRELLRDHTITYFCLDDGDRADDAVQRATEYATRVITVPHQNAAVRRSARFVIEFGLSLFSPLPYFVWKYRSDAFRIALRAELASNPYDVVVCDFLVPAVNLLEPITVPTVIFQHNVEAAIWERHAAAADTPLRRWLFRTQWNRTRNFEGRACRRFDGVMAVSEHDANMLRTDYGLRDVDFVETGVDTTYFVPQAIERNANELVFVGAMDWMPNEQGILWFVRKIFPRIVSQHPEARLTIVGRNPTPSVQALASDARITVTGTVPDVRPYFARAGVVVVPLQVGGGTRLKIFEAMAMNAPVIATSIGAEGLRIEADTHFLRCDDEAEYADACVRSLREPALAAQMGVRGGTFVRAHFSWEAVTARFSAYLERIAGAHRTV